MNKASSRHANCGQSEASYLTAKPRWLYGHPHDHPAKVPTLISLRPLLLLSIFGVALGGFFHPFFDNFVSYPRATVFAAAFLVLLVSGVMLFTARPTLGGVSGAAALCATVLLALGVAQAFQGYDISTLNYCIAPLVGVVLARYAGSQFEKFLYYSLWFCLVLAGSERITGNYWFVVVQDGALVLDETFFGGATGVFRAKGPFNGPLTLGAFAMVCAFVFRSRPIVLILPLALAALSASRTGMAAVVFVMAANLLSQPRSPDKRARLAKIVTTLGLLGLGAYFITDEVWLLRLLQIADWSSGANSARLYYWDLGWHVYISNPSSLAQLLGAPGYGRELIGNSAESDYLQILLDAGAIGLALVIFPLLWGVVRALRTRNRLDAASIIGLGVVMAGFPLSATLVGGIVTWYFLAQAGMPNRGAVTGARPLPTNDFQRLPGFAG